MGLQLRRPALATLLCLAVAPGLWWQPRQSEGERTGNLWVKPIPTGVSEPEVRGLTSAGVWLLASDDRRFSGYSALVVRDGGRLRAYSDSSRWLEFDSPDRPNISPARFGSVPGHEGGGYNDLEAAAYDSVSGKTWLAFEHLNSIRRVGPREEDAISVTPPAMAGFGHNGGAETMVRLADGRLVVIAESADWLSPGRRTALVFAQDPVIDQRAEVFAFDPPRGYDPTDAALLPDGRVLILLRGLALWQWPPFASKLLVADPANIRPGEPWPWREVADLSDLMPPENYEGLAVKAGEAGLEVWLIADANRSLLIQRTLLVKLIWNEPARAGARIRRLARPF